MDGLYPIMIITLQVLGFIQTFDNSCFSLPYMKVENNVIYSLFMISRLYI